MIPVYQDTFGHQEGNCAWACIASIFELCLDDLRGERSGPTDYNLRVWTEENLPDHEYHYVDRARNYHLVPGPSVPEHPYPERWCYDVPEGPFLPPEPEYWIGVIFSLEITRPPEDPYYPMPGLHAVVMRGIEMVHDPHPRNPWPRPTPPIVAMSWWTTR